MNRTKFDTRDAQEYAKKMYDIVQYLKNNCNTKLTLFKTFDVKKQHGAIFLKNFSSVHKNLLFNISDISPDSFQGWTSKAQIGINFKLDYFSNGMESSNNVVIQEERSASGYDYYTEEQLIDDGFIFQQSLVLEDYALFSICCCSWLHIMGLKYIFIVCEYDIDDMSRIHEELFSNDDE